MIFDLIQQPKLSTELPTMGPCAQRKLTLLFGRGASTWSYYFFLTRFCQIPGPYLEGSEENKYLWLALNHALRYI